MLPASLVKWSAVNISRYVCFFIFLLMFFRFYFLSLIVAILVALCRKLLIVVFPCSSLAVPYVVFVGISGSIFVWVVAVFVVVEQMVRTRSSCIEVTPLMVHSRVGRTRLPPQVATTECRERTGRSSKMSINMFEVSMLRMRRSVTRARSKARLDKT